MFVSLLNQFGLNGGDKDEEDLRQQPLDNSEINSPPSPTIPLSKEEGNRDISYISFPFQEQGKECHMSKEEGLWWIQTLAWFVWCVIFVYGASQIWPWVLVCLKPEPSSWLRCEHLYDKKTVTSNINLDVFAGFPWKGGCVCVQYVRWDNVHQWRLMESSINLSAGIKISGYNSYILNVRQFVSVSAY